MNEWIQRKEEEENNLEKIYVDICWKQRPGVIGWMPSPVNFITLSSYLWVFAHSRHSKNATLPETKMGQEIKEIDVLD